MTTVDDFEDEQEWTVAGFIAECDRITSNPPAAPAGFELIECEATPRHWPIYAAYVDGAYPTPCFICQRDELDRAVEKAHCQLKHRRWKSWPIWWHINLRLYSLGITSSGGSLHIGRCEFCGIARQHAAPCWRGRRSYILGAKREFWTCLRRGHRHSPTYYGLCSVCCPCPSCGSTDPSHEGDCGQVAA